MAVSASITNFAVSLQKLTNPINPDEILRIVYISNERIFIIHYKNGNLVAVNTDNGMENSTVIVNNILQIRLLSCKKGPQSSSISILALDHGSNLSVHDVVIETQSQTVLTSCTAKCNKEKLHEFLQECKKTDLPDASNIHLLGFEASSLATILLDNTVLVLRFPQGSDPEVKQSLCLVWDPKEGSVIHCKLLQGLVFLLHQSGNITIHSLSERCMVATIHFQKFLHELYPHANADVFGPYQPEYFDVSPNLQNLILTQHQAKYSIYKVSLNEYFDTYPYHLKAQRLSKSFFPSTTFDRDEDEISYTHGGVRVQQQGSAGNRGFLNVLSSASRLLSRKAAQHQSLTSASQTKLPRNPKPSSVTQEEVNWFEHVGLTTTTPSSAVIDSTTRNQKARRISGFDKPRARQETLASYRPKLIIRKQDEEDSSSPKPSAAIRASKAFRDLMVAGMSVTGNSALIWYRGNAKLDVNKGRYGGVCLVELKTNDVEYYSFTEPVVVTFAPDSTHPHLLLSSGRIDAVAYGVDQELLVNKLMIYSSASLAETVCHLNHWDHYSIPIHALEVGLKQRQLDTVAFFLKSRENVFRYSPAPGSPTRGTSSPRIPSPLTPDQTQLWPAIDLLMTSIRSHARDHQSRQYAMQLLNLTLAYVNKLIENASETVKVVSQEGEGGLGILEGFNLTQEVLEGALQRLTGYVKEMWVYLKGCPKWIIAEKQLADISTDKDEVDSGSRDFFLPEEKTAQKYIKKWQKMPQQEVIKDAILKRCLPLAQAYLRSVCGGSEVKVQMSDLIDQGLHLMLSALLDGDLVTASTMLQHMGYDVYAHLKKMCLYTANHSLRDFLVNHLSQSEQFTPEEEGMIGFIHQLERLYTCQSFDKAKTLALESGKRSWAGVVPPKQSLNLSAQYFLEMRLQRGELVACEPPNCENFHYADIVLEWIRTWDKEMRERILLDVLLYSRDTSFRPNLNPKSIWQYLTAHCDWKHIAEWIGTSHPIQGSHAKPEHPNLVLAQPLFAQAADDLEACPGYLREKILDELASRGIFSSMELSKFNLLLTRLGGNLQLYADQSSFHGDRDLREQFNPWLIELCLREDLSSILYLYFDFYGLYLSENEMISMQPPLSDSRWLEMLLHFRWVGRQTTDPSLMFQASLSNSRLLLGDSQPTVSQLLESGHALVALATLIYAPGTFTEAMGPATTVEEQLWKVDAKTMEGALKPYPKLQAAVFPPIDLDGVSQQDITVYQLLQGNCLYDPVRLYKWQTTNPLVHRRNRTEMPHFSQSHLACQYAHSEAFRFTYYLYQGRPSFAYLAFLASQLQGGGTLTKKGVLAAYLKAYCTAVKSFSNRIIAAACVAFIEMLGQDSMSIRVDLQTARTILDHSKDNGGGRAKSSKAKDLLEQTLVKMLLACLRGSKKNAGDLLRLLEDAITSKLILQKIHRSSWEASEEWSLAILVCRRHQLSLSAVYPEQCALDDQWFHFSCFVQAHQYPKQQVLDLLTKFSSDTVREHLRDAFRNLHLGPALIRDDEPTVSGRSSSQWAHRRDIKAHYYQRVGFFRRHNPNVSSEDDTTGGSEDTVSTDEAIPQVVAPQELDVSRVSGDLFGVLFDCNSTPDPWKTLLAHAVVLREPVLAIIAACYKECVTLDCLCTWLLTSLDDPTSVDKVTVDMASVQWHSWTLEELAAIIGVAMATGQVTLLAKGFYIFDKDCTMNPFFDFCEAMLVKCDTSLAKTCLQIFHTAALKCRRKSIIGSGTQGKQTVPDFKIGNLHWYEGTASSVVYSMVSTCPSHWATSCLLEVLAQANFSRIVSRQVPDYNKLHKMTQALTDTQIHTHITCLLEGTEYMGECHRVLQCLKEAKQFDKAKEFASVAGIPVDQVIVEQLLCDLRDFQRSKVWHADAGRMIFWKKCNNAFKTNRVSGIAASAFFHNQAKDQSILQTWEKATLLSFAHRWLVKETTTSPEQKANAEVLQQEAWRWRLKAEVEKMETTSALPSLLEGAFRAGHVETFDLMDFRKYRMSEELLYIANVKVDAFVPPILKDEQEVQALNCILGQLLDKCCIQQAHTLAKQFNHPFEDLSIILTTIQLATGYISPSEMEPEMRRLVAALGPSGPGGTPGVRGRSRLMSDAWRGTMSKGLLTRSASTMSVSSMVSLDQTEEPEETDETLSAIEALCFNASTQAKQCCDRIINAYKIAQVLGCSYKAIVVQAPFDSLKSILRCSHPKRFVLAKTFILANEMTDIQVAGFLCEAVVTSLKTRQPRRREGLSSRLSSASLSSYLGLELGEKEEFSQLSQLCRNPAILGNRLLQEATSLVSSDAASTKSVFSMEVELIIRAHDCHTVCCNMEGISNVLRKCRECSDALAMAEEFTLLVWLLTGVGRYCEMSYVFDILRANQKLELLFKRGVKDDNLKVALLDYLKRCDPPDTEAYNFVAVKFEMNREIAELLERDGHEQLKAMNKKSMDANIELQNSLQVILQDFTKAAQSYAKDNCLRHAEQCVKQARLVALQLHLLPTKQHVLNLDAKAMASFMSRHPRFHEALIVADAYGKHTYWSDAVYHNVVIQGDFKYLEDYLKCLPFNNDTLFEEVANKYRQESSRVHQATINMKKLLGYCEEVVTTYKIATELSFQDVAVSLLEGEAGAYLKDVA